MTHLSNKYHDCDSCAFQEEDHAICDECEDADQWEPAEDIDDELSGSYYGSVKIVKIVKRRNRDDEKIAA